MVPPQMRVNMSNIENESAEFAVNCNPGTTAKSSPHPDKHQAKGHGKAMLNRIRAAHLAGKPKKTRHLIRIYLNSHAAHLAATHLARRSLRAHRHFPEALVSVIAAGLDPWAGTTEEVRVSYIPKGSDRDDRRTTMEFGPENKALQYLVLIVLKVVADLHPHQFGTGNGGPHAAIKHIAQAMKDGFVWAIEIDIENCFPSFDGKKIIDLLPIPKEVTERVLLPVHLNLVPGNLIDLFGTMSGGVHSHTPHTTPVGPAGDLGPGGAQILAEARQGLAQGSATSALLAEMLLSVSLKEVPNLGPVFGYVDNFVVMAKSENDVVTMTKALGSSLKGHPAGPLRPKMKGFFPAGDPVEVLGHRLIGGPGAIKIEASPANLAEFELQMKKGVFSLRKPGLSPGARSKKAQHLARKLHGWVSAFRLCHDAELYKVHWLAKIADCS